MLTVGVPAVGFISLPAVTVKLLLIVPVYASVACMETENDVSVEIPADENHDLLTGIVRLPFDVLPVHRVVLLYLTVTDTLLPLPFVNVAT